MAKRVLLASSTQMSVFARPRRLKLCLAIYLITVLCQTGEVRSGEAFGNGLSTEPRALTPSEVVSDTVAAGEARVYALDMAAGQQAHVEVMKGDAKLKVSVCAQPESPCLELIGRRYGKVDLYFSSDAPARYSVEIRSMEADAAERSYRLRLADVNGAAPRRELDDATRMEADAESLRDRQDKDSQLAAASKYDEAQRLWESAGEFGRAAETLCEIGDIYLSLSQYRQAMSFYEKALSLSERGDPLARLAALNGIGYTYVSQGENQKALYYAQEMLEAVERADYAERESAEYKRAKAQALNIKGEAFYAFGQLRESIDTFDIALSLWTEAVERRGQALAFLNLGYSYSDLGNSQAALEHFQRSLALWQSINDVRGMAVAQTALGGTYSTLGEDQLALGMHQQAVAQCRAVGNRQGEGVALNGVASAYHDLNDYQNALDNYFAAMRIFEAVENRDFAALNKFLIGRVLYQQGEIDRAFTLYRESLNLSRAVGDPVVEAHALRGLATIYFSRGDASHALARFGAALKIYLRVGNRRSQAYLLNDIGHIYDSSGDVPKALATYSEALPIMRDIGDRRGEALTLFNTAQAEMARGNLASAQSLVEESIAIGETLRTKIKNSQLRSSYFAAMHQQYELYIQVLMRRHAQQPDKGFAAQALLASERARARSLLDSLFEGRLDPKKGLSTSLLQREQELLRTLDEKAEYQTRLLAGKHTSEEAEQLSQEIRALTIEYQDVRSKLREQSPRLVTLTQPDQIRAEDIQGIVKDGDTILLEFALGDERSYLWAVSAGEIDGYELPGRSTIENLARRTYELLTTRQSMTEQQGRADEEKIKEADAEYWRESAALSTMLLGQVADRLGSKRLLLVGDGFLNYIPFEALPTPGQPPPPAGSADPELLFFNHEIVGLPSALTLAALRSVEHPLETTKTKTVAVIADPVFEKDDPRVLKRSEAAALVKRDEDESNLSGALRDFDGNGESPVISRLPSTLREAKAIMAVTPPGEGMLASGFAATKEQVAGEGLRNYRIVHFATHGLLNSESPELSGIILSLVDEQGASREGFLRLHDIYNMDLTADLVVLSACRTSLGRSVQGEGVVGLAGGFMYAGAKSVVASLWKVDDDATAELMGHFYTAMLKDGLPPAAALRAAKREIWKQERWRAPFYWAGFTLQGEYTENLRVPSRTNRTRNFLILGAFFLLVIASICVAAVRYRRAQRPA